MQPNNEFHQDVPIRLNNRPAAHIQSEADLSAQQNTFCFYFGYSKTNVLDRFAQTVDCNLRKCHPRVCVTPLTENM